MSHLASAFTMALLSSLPVLLIAVIGIVLSNSRLRPSHAKARRLATIGFGLLALQSLGGSTARAYIAVLGAESGDRVALANYITLTNAVAHPLLWASLILLLLAVLADRESSGPSRVAIQPVAGAER